MGEFPDGRALSYLKVQIMRPNPIFALFALTLCSAGCQDSLGSAPTTDPERDYLFRIVVVGDGVESTTDRNFINQVDSANPEQGLAIWEGVELAFENAPSFKALKPLAVASGERLFALHGYDDGGNAAEAQEIATELYTDPSVLAVIGHATSGTTRAAGHIYESAGIPLLVPSATSPNALCGKGPPTTCPGRLSNAFRLAPRDDMIQAPALVWQIRELELDRIYVLVETSKDANVYTRPLAKALEGLLQPPGELNDDAQEEKVSAKSNDEVQEREFRVEKFWSKSVKPGPLDDVVKGVALEAPTAVVFVGYAKRARDLLEKLDQEYKKNPRLDRPAVLLTDGCKQKGFLDHDFDVYITFPIGDEICKGETNTQAEALRAKVGDGPKSFQGQGYDAMLMLGSAIRECHEPGARISRACLLEKLRSREVFVGACDVYSLSTGENLYADYYIHHIGGKTILLPNKEILRAWQDSGN